MSKNLKVFVKDYEELHKKFPNKWAVVYDLVPGRGLFDGGTVYNVSDTDEGSVKLLKDFLSEVKPTKEYTILPTSPIDTDGLSYFKD